MKTICILQERTRKDVFAQVNDARSFTYTTSCNMEKSVKDVRVSIVKPYPSQDDSRLILLASARPSRIHESDWSLAGSLQRDVSYNS